MAFGAAATSRLLRHRVGPEASRERRSLTHAAAVKHAAGGPRARARSVVQRWNRLAAQGWFCGSTGRGEGGEGGG